MEKNKELELPGECKHRRDHGLLVVLLAVYVTICLICSFSLYRSSLIGPRYRQPSDPTVGEVLMQKIGTNPDMVPVSSNKEARLEAGVATILDQDLLQNQLYSASAK